MGWFSKQYLANMYLYSTFPNKLMQFKVLYKQEGTKYLNNRAHQIKIEINPFNYKNKMLNIIIKIRNIKMKEKLNMKYTKIL